MGRWPLASELEVNDLFRAGEGRFVGDGDPFPVDWDPEVGVGSVPYPPDFDEMVSVFSFHNFLCVLDALRPDAALDRFRHRQRPATAALVPND